MTRKTHFTIEIHGSPGADDEAHRTAKLVTSVARELFGGAAQANQLGATPAAKPSRKRRSTAKRTRR